MSGDIADAIIREAAESLVAARTAWKQEWTVAVELCTHVLGRAFGFQLVNAAQEKLQERQCILATTGVAADHLIQLLKDRAAVVAHEGSTPGKKRSDKPQGFSFSTQPSLSVRVFEHAVESLHEVLFRQSTYEAWQKKCEVTHLTERKEVLCGGDNPIAQEKLMHLALFMCLWTEAANLRHTPELLWLIYHMMLTSDVYTEAKKLLGLNLQQENGAHNNGPYALKAWLQDHRADSPDHNQDRDAASSDEGGSSSSHGSDGQQQQPELIPDVVAEDALQLGFVRGVLLPVRNALGNAARVGALLEDGPGPYRRDNSRAGLQAQLSASSRTVSTGDNMAWWRDSNPSTAALAVRQARGLELLRAKSSGAEAWSLSQLVVEDIMYFGDGCIFLDMVVQPVFNLMAEQIALMGEAGEAPALRLGYDDFNESCWMREVMMALGGKRDLLNLQSAAGDPWNALLQVFVTEHVAQEESWKANRYREDLFSPIPSSNQRYPRDQRRLDSMAVLLRDAGAGGQGYEQVYRATQLQQRQAGQGDYQPPSTGGSMPVVHLHASQRLTNILWAKVFKKSFIETRSLGAVLVAFNRVYVLHAILLCWMTLLAYAVPELQLHRLFNREMWTSTQNRWWSEGGRTNEQGKGEHEVPNYLVVLECLAWGLVVHSVMHFIKDLLLFHLLRAPKATRVFTITGQQAADPDHRSKHHGQPKQQQQQEDLEAPRPKAAAPVRPATAKKPATVTPKTHTARAIVLHNVLTAIWWLAWTGLLIASHVPALPPHKALAKVLTRKNATKPLMPVYGLVALAYVGLGLLQAVLQLMGDQLPRKVAFLARTVRKENARMAEHYLPFSAMRASQSLKHSIINVLLWVVVLLIKVLFDFFVVLQPMATGPVHKMIKGLETTQFSSSFVNGFAWAQVGLVVWSLWVTVAIMVFFDTGLFWSVVSGVYSTYILGVHQRVGKVKTWYDLVAAFPRLALKFNEKILPACQQAAWYGKYGDAGGLATSPPAAAVASKSNNTSKPIPEDAAAAVDFQQDIDGSKDQSGTSEAQDPPALDNFQLSLQPLPLHPRHQVAFAQAWDEIITDLRDRDLLTNADEANLKYTHLRWADDHQQAWLLLPRLMVAGAAVEASIQQGISSLSQQVAVAQSFNLLLWVLMACNMLDEDEVRQHLLSVNAEDETPLFKRWFSWCVNAFKKHPNRAEATEAELLLAADVLVKSKDLLKKLKGMLDNPETPFLVLSALDKQALDDHLRTVAGPCEDVTKMELLSSKCDRSLYSFDLEKQLLFEGVLSGVQKLGKLRPRQADQQASLTDRPCQRERFLDTLGDEQRMGQLRDTFMVGIESARRYDVNAQELSKAASQWWQEELEIRSRRRLLLQQVVDWLLFMLEKSRGEAAPHSSEAKRALTFFATSLSNPKMPSAQPVGLTRSMTTLTPHYGEDVVYALSGSAAKTELSAATAKYDPNNLDNCFLFRDDGEPTDTLRYLRTVYEGDWLAFRERLLQQQGVKEALSRPGSGKPTVHDIEEASFLPGRPLEQWRQHFLIWASMRGQLLQRTVHGMMRYEAGLQQLAMMQLRADLKAATADHARQLTAGDPVAADKWQEAVVREAALLVAREKYRYVVTSQVLGEMGMSGKASERWLAYAVRELVAKSYPSLCIAYIDLENVGEAKVAPLMSPHEQQPHSWELSPLMEEPRNRSRGSKPYQLLRQYSVLLQYSDGTGQGSNRPGVRELYRVRLPMNLETGRGVILGEGKPENQNHAIIFCHGETVQTIDCNQDNFLVEALKLPNLLGEFEYQDGRPINVRGSLQKSAKSRCCAGDPSSERRDRGPALVGFREWVFSADSGALAVFAAATERSFGTTVQRVMYNPGGVRFHYGHPDVWDKLFTMTNGGVSKSTKSLHVSEDVFGGYNVMLRGRDIVFRDYFAVGKGRDMGLETIVTFEAKVAAGNGEQVVSRDVSRLARRMNLPRLLSWYFTGNGFFINTALLMYSMLVNAWLCLLLVFMREISATGVDFIRETMNWLAGIQLLQIGSLGVLVYILTVALEHGLMKTMQQVLQQIVAGSMLFFVFRSQSSAAAFNSDLAFGGAAYAATGRGYKLNATPFIDLFQDYARSHMWYGAQLLIMLVVALSCGLHAGVFQLISTLLAILALLAAPFWFNPFTFDWQKNKDASKEFVAWMDGNKPAGRKRRLWRQFNSDQLAKARNDNGKQLGRMGRCVVDFLFMIPGMILVVIAVWGMLSEPWMGGAVFVIVTGLLLLLLGVWQAGNKLEAASGPSTVGRAAKFFVNFMVLAGAALLLVFIYKESKERWNRVGLWSITVKVLYIEFELARFFGRFLVAVVPQWPFARRVVDSLCWAGDYALGMLLLLMLFTGSLFGLLTRFQATVLFSVAFANSYLANENLKHSELGRLAKELKDLQVKDRPASNSTGRSQEPSSSGSSGGGPGGGGGGGPGTGGGGDKGSSNSSSVEAAFDGATAATTTSDQTAAREEAAPEPRAASSSQPSQPRPSARPVHRPAGRVAAARASFSSEQPQARLPTPEAAAAAASSLQVTKGCHLTKMAAAAESARVTTRSGYATPLVPASPHAAEASPFAQTAGQAAEAAAGASSSPGGPLEPAVLQAALLKAFGSKKARELQEQDAQLQQTLSWTDSLLEPQPSATTLADLTDAAEAPTAQAVQRFAGTTMTGSGMPAGDAAEAQK